MTFTYLYLLDYSHNEKRITVKREWQIDDEMDDKAVARKAQDKYPNLPILLWREMQQKQENFEVIYTNDSCGSLPNLLAFQIENKYWQISKMNNMTFNLYSAFFDKRKSMAGARVRVLGMLDRTPESISNASVPYFCQVWYKDEIVPVIVRLSRFHFIWRKNWKVYTRMKLLPYLMDCKIPVNLYDKIPMAVSIVENPCDQANNLLRIVYKRPKVRKNFAVCVKGLDFLQSDVSIRLMEWLELLFAMGVDKVYLYQLQLHPNVKTFLERYKKTGKIDLREITLPPGHPNIPLVQHSFINSHYEKKFDELIPYNDCFYRNIYSYNYVVFLDIDEIIIPTYDYTWMEMMNRVRNVSKEKLKNSKRKRRFASFNARNAYFLDSMQNETALQNESNYLHILQHVHRSSLLTKQRWYVKTFFDTRHVITCHNHFPIEITPGSLVSFDIDPKYALMHHYREKCHHQVNCTLYLEKIIEDTTVWKYKDKVLRNMKKELNEMGYVL